jgi:uncharacterized protein YcbK (DUF882 family)
MAVYGFKYQVVLYVLKVLAKLHILSKGDFKMSVKQYSLETDGEKLIAANFKVKEFACKDNSDTILIDSDFVKDFLQKIRDHFGRPVTINSAYRTVAYNKKIGGATNSYHTKGMAFDIKIYGVTPAEIAQYASLLGVHGIIQYDNFVHVDARTTTYKAVNKNGNITVVKGF